MRIFFITMYLIPLIVTLLASGPSVRRNPGLGMPIFFAAILPAVNMAAAVGAIAVLFYNYITSPKK